MFDVCCCIVIILLIILSLFFILMLTYIKPNIGNEKVKITRNDNINSIYRKTNGGSHVSINYKKTGLLIDTKETKDISSFLTSFSWLCRRLLNKIKQNKTLQIKLK